MFWLRNRKLVCLIILSYNICTKSLILEIFNLFKANKKKIPEFSVTRPYLNLQVKPGGFFFFQVFWKNMILCILKDERLFKMHKIILFFSRKKK